MGPCLSAFSLFATLLFGSLVAFAQTSAPTDHCDFHGGRNDAVVREISRPAPAPYHFACGVRGSSTCIAGTLPAGLVVSVDREENGWSCVTGGDSTSGWVETSRLIPLPAEPKIPLPEWVGWWRQGKRVHGLKSDVLLLTSGRAPGSLRVSGKAYWYGPVVDGAPVEHFGQVNGEAVPVGNHLHVVEENADNDHGCVVDLTLVRTEGPAHLVAYDNMQCGGANVRFGRSWERFTPKRKERSLGK